ncbi:MAG: hypothetical protein AAF371_01695 [Pseudomonadota bacterium]
MVENLVITLILFTLGGGLLYAIWNWYRTRKLNEHDKNPGEIPKVYQKHTERKDAGIGI